MYRTFWAAFVFHTATIFAFSPVVCREEQGTDLKDPFLYLHDRLIQSQQNLIKIPDNK